jgi:hypothetical protein
MTLDTLILTIQKYDIETILADFDVVTYRKQYCRVCGEKEKNWAIHTKIKHDYDVSVSNDEGTLHQKTINILDGNIKTITIALR